MVKRFELIKDVVRDAIASAEERTTAEVRLVVRKRSKLSPSEMARKMFEKLGMEKTSEGNGLLIVIEPEIRRITLYGGHEKYSDEETAIETALAKFKEHFKNGDYHAGIRQGLAAVGEMLSRVFPLAEGAENPNELPDELAIEE